MRLCFIATHALAIQIALAGIVLVGCKPGPGGIDNPDGGTSIDADTDSSEALYVELEAKPKRGAFNGDFEPTLDDIDIGLSNFRVIGDSAPGDSRTMVESLSLTFPENDDLRTLAFNDAPIGRYSRIRARIDHFKLGGTLVINGQSLIWLIDVAPPQGIEIDFDVAPIDLDPGVDARIKITVRLDRAFGEVDWNDLIPDNGTITADSSYEDFGELLGKIRNETFTGSE